MTIPHSSYDTVCRRHFHIGVDKNVSEDSICNNVRDYLWDFYQDVKDTLRFGLDRLLQDGVENFAFVDQDDCATIVKTTPCNAIEKAMKDWFENIGLVISEIRNDDVRIATIDVSINDLDFNYGLEINVDYSFHSEEEPNSNHLIIVRQEIFTL